MPDVKRSDGFGASGSSPRAPVIIEDISSSFKKKANRAMVGNQSIVFKVYEGIIHHLQKAEGIFVSKKKVSPKPSPFKD